MAVKIMRGDSYYIPIDIAQDGQTVTADVVEDIEISIGENIQKRMSKGEVIYQDGSWYFRLSQEESFALEDSSMVYVRIVYAGNQRDVVGVCAGMIIALETGSSEVL